MPDGCRSRGAARHSAGWLVGSGVLRTGLVHPVAVVVFVDAFGVVVLGGGGVVPSLPLVQSFGGVYRMLRSGAIGHGPAVVLRRIQLAIDTQLTVSDVTWRVSCGLSWPVSCCVSLTADRYPSRFQPAVTSCDAV